MTHIGDLNSHPCFSAKTAHSVGRIHLPVAATCNIKCQYCNRKYDCMNESRPGVTSAVLAPEQALKYLERVVEKEPRITVVGIAGPGDPMANASATLQTLNLVRKRFPNMMLCLATNGLALPAYLDELASIGVSHVTITINAVDPAIAEKVYAWARDGKVIYRGIEAAKLLIERQLASVSGLHERGIMTKVNTIVIPGVNDLHAVEVAREVAARGATVMNCMPVYPVSGTIFEGLTEPSDAMMSAIRKEAEQYLPQVRHCKRCRADAVGLLGEDRSGELRADLEACRALPATEDLESKPYVAVATHEGLLVNQHLGEATRFQIWGESSNGGYHLIEERPAPRPGAGIQRWEAVADLLKDCRAILVSGIGDRPSEILKNASIRPVEMNGFIEMGLDLVYRGGNLTMLKSRRQGCAKGAGCAGDGAGC